MHPIKLLKRKWNSFLKLQKIKRLSKYNEYYDKKLDIFYDPRSDIGKVLLLGNEFENDEITICEKYIKKDSCVWDIGANIGFHSQLFAKMAHNGIIYSFEPSNTTFLFLVKNCLKFSNVIPINLALSDKGGLSDFYVASDNAFSSLKNTKLKPISEVRKILTIKMDDFVNITKITPPDFVKIDVEGFENEVLHGMFNTICNYTPVIFCEIFKGKNSNLNPDETVAYMEKLHYKAFVLVNRKLEQYALHSDEYYNYFFIPEKKMIK